MTKILWVPSPDNQKEEQQTAWESTPTEPTIIKQVVYGRQYHHSDPIGRLIGEVNEVTVLIDGVQTKALVDSGAQMSAMTDSFAQ